MRKLVLSMFMSLDGSITGPDGEFLGPDWSDDLGTHWSGHAMKNAGHFVYGRVNFEFNKAFWAPAETDPSSVAASVAYAPKMNGMPKTVFSRTLTGDPGWNATIAGPDMAAEIACLRALDAPGDLFCFGGAGIAQSLVALDLVDEYRLMITPNLFGGGKRLFEPGFARIDLDRVETLPLDTGAVILRYVRKR